MHRSVYILVVMLFLSAGLHAQYMDYGIKGGLNIGTPYGVAEEGATGSPGIGPLIGMFFKYNLSDKWAVHGDFSYSFKGSSFDTPVSGDTLYEWTQKHPTHPGTDTTYYAQTTYEGYVDGEYANWYFDIPVYISYRLSRSFIIFGGAQVSYLVKGKNKGSADIIVGDPKSPYTKVYGEPFDQSNELNTWDYGLILGTQLEGKKRLNLGISLTCGLGSIYHKNYKYIDNVIRNIYLQTFLGFRINGSSAK
ncbi:MAG: porin family protein [Bacteroidales bacterium]